MWRSSDSGCIFCEVKLSEENFGTAKINLERQHKLKTIYRPRLEPLLKSHDLLEERVFFRHYQLLRNVSLLAENPEHKLVILFPRENELLEDPLRTVLDNIQPAVRNRIKKTYLEDCLTYLKQETSISQKLGEHSADIEEKYIVPASKRGFTEMRLPATQLLTGRDLIVALGWHCRLLGVDNEFAEYWHLRFELLSRAFDLPPEWHKDRARTPRMIGAIAPDACGDGFFSGFLEYTPLLGEMTITEYHKPRIKTAEANLREHFLEYGEALLLEFWPQVQGKIVDEDQLVVAGLPPQQPDVNDFM
jgi:hypothetical protein